MCNRRISYMNKRTLEQTFKIVEGGGDFRSNMAKVEIEVVLIRFDISSRLYINLYITDLYLLTLLYFDFFFAAVLQNKQTDNKKTSFYAKYIFLWIYSKMYHPEK